MDKYEVASITLAKAIDMAIEAYQKYPDTILGNQQQAIEVMTEWKGWCLNPEKKFRNLTSLKYIRQDLLSVFERTGDSRTEYFWQRLREEHIDYDRVDLLKKIIKRKRIANRIEYEYVQDNIVFAQQDGRISQEEALEIGRWIGQYESKAEGQ